MPNVGNFSWLLLIRSCIGSHSHLDDLAYVASTEGIARFVSYCIYVLGQPGPDFRITHIVSSANVYTVVPQFFGFGRDISIAVKASLI